MKKRIAIVDVDDDDNLDNTRNTTEEINTSKPVISSVFAAHNIKTEEPEKAEEKNEQIEDTTTAAETNIETIASSAIVHNNTSSPYSFETFESSNREQEEEKIEETEKAEENNYNQNENTEAISEEEDKASEKSEEIETKEELVEEEKETVVEETKEFDVITEEKTEADTDEVEKIEETVKVEEKATYSKSDIFKRPVVIPTDDDHIQKSKFNQEEIDTAIKSAPIVDENTSVENYKDYSSSPSETKIEELKETINEKIQELKDKEIKIIETEDELKTSSLPEIEKKPAEPYVAPDHSISENKKSNKIVPIVGIIIIILGLSFLGVQFFSGKNNEIDDNFYEEVTNNNTLNTNDLLTNNVISVTNNINTNINRQQTNNIKTNNAVNTNATRPQTNNALNTQTNTTRPQTNNAVNTQTNTTRPQTNNAVNTQTNTARPQTNNTVNTQTNTATPPTPPKEPEITPPTPPTPPPNPPTANTNAAANNTQANNTDTYKTKWTDTLSSIATAELGDSRRWPSIAVLNENIIKNNPDSIVFNIDIKIPNGGKKKIEDMNDSEKRALYNDYMKVSEMYLKMGKQNLANSIKAQANSILK